MDIKNTSTLINNLNYNILEQQQLVVLNELKTIPNALTAALKSFTEQGGIIIIIPSLDINTSSYNGLLNNFGTNFNNLIEAEKRVTTINYNHSLYNGVFEKKVTNFQYPKVNKYYTIKANNATSVLQFEDNKPFLFQNSNAFIFTAALNAKNSSFKNTPLIVPTLYNIGKFSLKIPEIYYTIGQENTFDIVTQLQQDDILSLAQNAINIIPKQQYFNNKVTISTLDTPDKASIYNIKNKEVSLKNVSYNYNRNESNLVYSPLKESKNITVSNSITEIFETIKSSSKINALWKWFVIFALALLIIEMLILKYFK